MAAGRSTGLRELRETADPHEDAVERLTFAWAESIALRGYNRTTVQHIVELSGLSRSTLYARFGGKDEAFVRIHAATLARFAGLLEAAVGAKPTWPAKIAVGLAAALGLAADNLREAQILLGDPFAAGPRMGYAHDLLVARLTPALAAGRPLALPSPPPSLEPCLVGSVVSIAGDRVRAGETAGLRALVPSLTEFVLTPYIGAEEAKRVARERNARAG